jgi:C1A family cysteine protease
MAKNSTTDNIPETSGFGWLKDIPDARDYTLDSEEVRPFVVDGADQDILPKDEIPSLPVQREQGKLGSCSAHAGTYLFEIHESVAGSSSPLSRRFLYKTTRNLLGLTGDTGAYLRTAMQAIAMVGVPPEKYWDYSVPDFDVEPGAFQYALARDYRGLTYYRLDPRGAGSEDVLLSIKTNIRLRRACMIGFVVYSFSDKGEALFPASGETKKGGHAVTIVGYDDGRTIRHPNGTTSTGAFKFANWWGLNWGEGGFGHIAYDFLREGLASDCWTMMTADWIDESLFGFS